MAKRSKTPGQRRTTRIIERTIAVPKGGLARTRRTSVAVTLPALACLGDPEAGSTPGRSRKFPRGK